MPARRNRPVEPECSPEVRGLFDKLGAGRASVDQHLVRNVVDGLHGQVPGSCSPEDLRRIFRQVDPDNSGKLMPDGSWGTAATGVLTLPQFAGAFQLLQRQFGDIPEQRLVELSHGVIAQRAERQKMRNRFLQGDSPQPKQQQSEPPAESPKGKGAKAKRAPPPQLQPSAPASQPQKQKQQQGDEPQSPARASAAQAGRQLRERWQQEEKQAGGKFNRMDFVQMKGFSHVDEQVRREPTANLARPAVGRLKAHGQWRVNAPAEPPAAAPAVTMSWVREGNSGPAPAPAPAPAPPPPAPAPQPEEEVETWFRAGDWEDEEPGTAAAAAAPVGQTPLTTRTGPGGRAPTVSSPQTTVHPGVEPSFDNTLNGGWRQRRPRSRAIVRPRPSATIVGTPASAQQSAAPVSPAAYTATRRGSAGSGDPGGLRTQSGGLTVGHMPTSLTSADAAGGGGGAAAALAAELSRMPSAGLRAVSRNNSAAAGGDGFGAEATPVVHPSTADGGAAAAAEPAAYASEPPRSASAQLEKFVPPQKKTLTWRKEKGQDWEGEKIEGDGGGGGGCCGLCGGVLVCERCDGLAEDRAALAEKLARAEFEAEQALCASERHEARAADMDGELRNLRRALEQAERKLVDAGNQRGVWARKIQAMEQEVAAARSVGGPQQHSQVDQHVSTLKSQLAHVEAELRQVTQERDEMQRREYAAAASVAGPYAAADGTEAAADALGAMSQQIWVLSRALELRSREADRLRDILASLQGRLSAVAPASPQAAELLAILQDLMQGTAASAAAAESESFGEGGIVQAVARAAGATADAVAALQEHLAAAAYATAEGSTAPSTVARVAQELQHSLHNGLGLGDAPSGVAAAAASGSGDAQWALAMEQRLLQARDRELQLVGVVSAREQELSDLWERLRQAQAAIVSSAGSGMENEVKLQQAKQALQKILEVLPHSRRQAVTEALGGRFSLSPAQQPPPQPPAGGHVHLMSDDDLLSGAVSTNRPLPAGSPEPARSPLPTHGGSPSAQVAAALAAAAVPRPPGWHRLLTPPGAAAPSR
eukprot:TRINITY_DN1790_c0_g1_i1.p1 TRINITY_DN1790_c0_g1~~TRINITY_DN1790_c0_g1_i1.p1  ORF type:complete len:1076 (+),score=270.68 TRINITY_DN1790_c0_g1_i1:86-3229(+)